MKELVLNGRKVRCELARKDVKNVNIRVGRDCVVRVSAPRRCPAEEVMRVLYGREKWILAALDRFQRRETAVRRYADGEVLELFGEPFQIALRAGKRNDAETRDGVLYLVLRDPADESARQRLASAWRDEMCRREISALCARAYPAFRARGVPYPAIAFRRMRARWGSCMYQKRRLIFNLNLADVPLGAAEYVVFHEFAHLLQPDHSAAFYRILDEVLPDWRDRRRILKNF